MPPTAACGRRRYMLHGRVGFCHPVFCPLSAGSDQWRVTIIFNSSHSDTVSVNFNLATYHLQVVPLFG